MCQAGSGQWWRLGGALLSVSADRVTVTLATTPKKNKKKQTSNLLSRNTIKRAISLNQSTTAVGQDSIPK